MIDKSFRKQFLKDIYDNFGGSEIPKESSSDPLWLRKLMFKTAIHDIRIFAYDARHYPPMQYNPDNQKVYYTGNALNTVNVDLNYLNISNAVRLRVMGLLRADDARDAIAEVTSVWKTRK